MILIPTFILFVLGLIIGSFLNVVILRMNTGKSIAKGRSVCMSCQSELSWYELIPLFSFWVLKGKCKTCKTKISIQYPLVELASGLVFAVVFCKFHNLFVIPIQNMYGIDISFHYISLFFINYIYYVATFSVLIVITVYDFRHKIIPDTLSLIFGILAFVGLFFFSHNSNFIFYLHIPTLFGFLSGIIIALPFFLLWFFSKGAWMGLGDAKLALGIGWFLGFSFALSALALSFWIGTIVGLGLVFFSKYFRWGYGMKSEIPFAPYLALGTFLAFVFELNLFNIYF